jgi:hypothetical protein
MLFLLLHVSFGTDSLLDKDIKERLMEQVFSVLAVQADDQQAYLAFHRAESEKRLSAQRANVRLEREAAEAAARAAAVKRPIRPVPPRKPTTTSDAIGAAAVSSSSEESQQQSQSIAGASSSPTPDDVIPAPKEPCSAERIAVRVALTTTMCGYVIVFISNSLLNFMSLCFDLGN